MHLDKSTKINSDKGFKFRLITLWDIILIVSIIAASFIMSAFISRKSGGDMLIIEVDGEIFGRYSIYDDQIIDIEGRNTVRISDGEVSMISSNCRGQDCVRTSPIGAVGGEIVCLPNRVILKIENKSEGVTDTVAG